MIALLFVLFYIRVFGAIALITTAIIGGLRYWQYRNRPIVVIGGGWIASLSIYSLLVSRTLHLALIGQTMTPATITAAVASVTVHLTEMGFCIALILYMLKGAKNDHPATPNV